MYAKHPELADEFEAATPKGKKLPERVAKKAYDAGVTQALESHGIKAAACEEIRLKLPRREYHGFEEAFRSAGRGEKRAEPNAEMLAEALQQFDAPTPAMPEAAKDKLDRDTLWGSPSHLGAGDTANRISDMGQPTQIGVAF